MTTAINPASNDRVKISRSCSFEGASNMGMLVMAFLKNAADNPAHPPERMEIRQALSVIWE